MIGAVLIYLPMVFKNILQNKVTDTPPSLSIMYYTSWGRGYRLFISNEVGEPSLIRYEPCLLRWVKKQIQ